MRNLRLKKRKQKQSVKEELKNISAGVSELKISFALVDNKRIKKLNRIFRGVDEVTDVLSFPMNEKLPDGVFFLGEIVIDKNQAEKQARKYGVSVKEELARLIAHGALHLLGYEDKVKKQREKMKKVEDKILTKLKS